MSSPAHALLKSKPTETTARGIERASKILETARAMLAAEGLAEISMRKIATGVGISLGNLQHYYASKEVLIDALLTYMMDGYQKEIAAALALHQTDSPHQRFMVAVDLLLERVNDPAERSIFLEVWALSSRPGFASELVRKVRAREHKAMTQLLRDFPGASNQQDLRVRASMIVLVIEGLMVQFGQDGMRLAARQELANAARGTVLQLASGSLTAH